MICMVYQRKIRRAHLHVFDFFPVRENISPREMEVGMERSPDNLE